MWTQDGFMNLARALYGLGLNIRIDMTHDEHLIDDIFWGCTAKNENVELLFFWMDSEGAEKYNCLFGDNAGLFDKLWTSPLIVRLSDERVDDLVKTAPAWIEFLGSRECWRYSNEFLFLRRGRSQAAEGNMMINWGVQREDALDYFRQELSLEPEVTRAIRLIRRSVIGLPDGEFSDELIAVVSGWINDVSYSVDVYDEMSDEFTRIGYIYARDMKAAIVGSEVAPYV